MSFFDAPISRCEAAQALVVTDQTQHQCALEHGCPPGRECPLGTCFARVSGVTETENLAAMAVAEPRQGAAVGAAGEVDEAVQGPQGAESAGG